MASVWANVLQQWIVTSSSNNCCRPTVLSAMLANISSTVHPRALWFLSWLSSCALAQYSVTHTKNFSTLAHPTPSSTRTCPVPSKSNPHLPCPQQVQPAPALSPASPTRTCPVPSKFNLHPHAKQCRFLHLPHKCGYPQPVHVNPPHAGL